jgi:hypothetical protein
MANQSRLLSVFTAAFFYLYTQSQSATEFCVAAALLIGARKRTALRIALADLSASILWNIATELIKLDPVVTGRSVSEREGHPSFCLATMHSFTRLFAVLTAVLSLTRALTFTSPSAGSTIDTSQSLTISWSVSFSDPGTIDLHIAKGSGSGTTLGTGLSSYAGTWTIPANTISGSGSGYTLFASANGNKLGSVSVSLGDKSATSASSVSASVTMFMTQTVVPMPASGSSIPTASVDSVGITTGISSNTGTGGFVTSTTTKQTGDTSTSTPTAGTTNTASGQRRLGSELVLGAAGVLAGLVALLA